MPDGRVGQAMITGIPGIAIRVAEAFRIIASLVTGEASDCMDFSRFVTQGRGVTGFYPDT